jgi:uncharacterized protein (DUF2252 family)
MAASPFAFLRGAPGIMARDLATCRTTGIRVQICGDAHLGNFGGFATPERNLVFDLNDFDETIAGPWEWDLLRLAASLTVCGRTNSISEAYCAAAIHAAARAYREQMRQYAEMRYLDIWYDRIDAEQAIAYVKLVADHPLAMERALDRGPRRTQLATLPKLAERADDTWLIADDPPLVIHEARGIVQRLHELVDGYKQSLPEERRVIVERYRLVDLARKVVGVGSVGTRCYVALLLGSHGEDPLFLQIKEARASVLEPYVARYPNREHGKRVVDGQRIMQAASDLFLGWARVGRRHYYVRQLRDMKTSVDLDDLHTGELAGYAALCGRTLARAHACSGDPARISGYLGKRDAFDKALATFARTYADQTERDHATFRKAIKSGRIPAERGV